MRNIPEPYNEIKELPGYRYDVKLVRGETTYGIDRLKSIAIDQAMFDGSGPQIGGVFSTQCEVKLKESSNSWPRAAEFEVFIRRCSEDGTLKSDWLSFGHYHTDMRSKDANGNMFIIAFDDMLTLEQPWTDKVEELPSAWPVTAQKACDMLQEALGIQFDSRTVLDDTVPFIGLDTTNTARETLAAVAAGMGGNWHITHERKLRLIPLVAPPDDHEYINLGMKVKDIKIGTVLDPVTTVELATASGTIAKASRGAGYTLKGNCEFSDSEAANLCMGNVFGYTYKPFEATSARLDPAAELGDLVQIDGEQYPLCSIHWRIGPHITADISAPYEEAIDHEYTIVSSSTKALRKAIGYTDGQIQSTRSYIQQTERSIMQGVAATYVNNQALETALQDYSPTAQIQQNYYNKAESDTQADALSSEIELTDNRLTLAFTQLRTDTENAINSMTYYIRYENGVVIVGKTDDPFSFRISNSKISLYYNNQEMSYWDNQKQYTPNELQIPTGGKFTLGKILCQPRTSGNMSWMWVGT